MSAEIRYLSRKRHSLEFELIAGQWTVKVPELCPCGTQVIPSSSLGELTTLTGSRISGRLIGHRRSMR